MGLRAYCGLVAALIVGVATAASTKAASLIVNGDFSGGNSGFTTDYVLSASTFNEGTYAVGTNPVLFHPSGFSHGDHTTGTGNMLIANGFNAPNRWLWQQTAAVAPNTIYQFSGWGASWGNNAGTDPSPARLQYAINGDYLAGAASLPAADGQWSSAIRLWYSNNAVSAALRIHDRNTDSIGNDFSIDDLAFVAIGAGPNLILNGDFSAGNYGVTTAYSQNNDLFPEGRYTIGTNPQNHHPSAGNFGDHTSGSGQMMLLNGSTAASTTAWEQTLLVEPGQTYAFTGLFSTWGNSGGGSDPGPATLRMTINGQPFTPDLTLPATNGQWSSFGDLWSSGSSTSATLRIVDLNTAVTGNDFAIDDLAFVAIPEPAGIALFTVTALVASASRRRRR